jgi:FKBP-type peptidyl-prolyl cis-trans isomerase (trigger factor)
MAKLNSKITSTVAKSEDGTIQITFLIPKTTIEESRDKALTNLAKNATISGFRKGKAPLEKVKMATDPNKLLEETLKYILPDAFSTAIKEHKLRPAIYPKFELISAKEGEDWQARAVTAELKEIVLGDYQKIISGALSATKIWTPDKAKNENENESDKPKSKEEKEQVVIKTLLEAIEVKIPQIIVNEEVDRRLVSLLERIEKLGLNLESYLASLGKTAETIRKEYEQTSRDTIKLELILNKIATEENVSISSKEVDSALSAAGLDPKKDSPEIQDQKRLVLSVLKRRTVLESLMLQV